MAPTANISRRHEITWSSAPSSEPTSTLVLTSPSGKFVDIRIFKATQPDSLSTGPNTSESLEWAIAGQTTYTTDPHGKRRGRWAHWVDSRSLEPAADEGDLETMAEAEVRRRWPELAQGGGLPEVTRETGAMVNPASGREEEYEEIWVDVGKEVPPRVKGAAVGEFPRAEGSCCVVARFEEEGDGRVVRRGLIVWIGQFCQGILRIGEHVTAERWEFDGEKGEWVRVYREGSGCLPCGWVVNESSDLREGREFMAPLGDGMKWKIVESDF